MKESYVVCNPSTWAVLEGNTLTITATTLPISKESLFLQYLENTQTFTETTLPVSKERISAVQFEISISI